MSKSGLFAHFGSKEELQLATVDHAADVFVREVIAPARSAPRGIARTWALLDGFLDYVQGEVFAGGCFFATTSAEFKNRPGAVRDRIAGELNAFVQNAEAEHQLFGDPRVFGDARDAIRERLESLRIQARAA